MEISTRAKERFCKDCNIPLRLFQEPYFMDRLKLYDKFYGTIEKWKVFVKELEKYHCEQDYFEEYNRVKDAAINTIKESEAYRRFNNEDMNKFAIKNKGLPAKDIFHLDNDGNIFISIDMRKANFSSLNHYDKSIFGGTNTWEEFIGKFTGNQHIIQSKYIRQVILGNCNPKRHITYEKYLMDSVVSFCKDNTNTNFDIVFFSNDEVVLKKKSECNYELALDIRSALESDLRGCVPFKVQMFTLHKINGTDGYYKKLSDGSIEFKCLDNYMLPFVLRKFLGEEITDSDRVFYHERLLAQFIEVPEIEVKENII